MPIQSIFNPRHQIVCIISSIDNIIDSFWLKTLLILDTKGVGEL